MTQLESKENLSYEQAFTELEQVLNRLEGESMNLEDSLLLFERGQFLTRYCADLLEKAQLRMQQLHVNLSSDETEEEEA
ncbi:MAG: exodeoxyribonuclease VII small subunit [Chloroflexi bacterium HGW-Chloroflexi-8]|nr:MAG: exodeoxyribonuclease VII small subunit [Chloroflexi bacterium HGW-Chloroflexi-8]